MSTCPSIDARFNGLRSYSTRPVFPYLQRCSFLVEPSSFHVLRAFDDWELYDAVHATERSIMQGGAAFARELTNVILI